MPLYEYECGSCGKRFERIQRFSDPAITVCPTCGGEVRKLVSSPAIQFKGSGFYITDYAKSGKATDGEKPDKGAADASQSGDKSASAGKTESSTKATSTEPSAAAKPADTKSKKPEAASKSPAGSD